jgi:hypothetical protein
VAGLTRSTLSAVDGDAQLVYEAAILDEAGYNEARELKIRQLQQRLF